MMPNVQTTQLMKTKLRRCFLAVFCRPGGVSNHGAHRSTLRCGISTNECNSPVPHFSPARSSSHERLPLNVGVRARTAFRAKSKPEAASIIAVCRHTTDISSTTTSALFNHLLTPRRPKRAENLSTARAMGNGLC
ncbi:hypothetical protein P154DRAFT_22495 [Amniculicola lignicola CBS 123094]|uniref:Uncharacterized protein n=1 Tax=Amniculicola lignicola CBS 123094 TaxID=1392246 RepID=A0A6A5WVD8_9PLEO|nr:hypothetical protein P154DRAFT_22495 [Amniculicola lignicola CBS 123094]